MISKLRSCWYLGRILVRWCMSATVLAFAVSTYPCSPEFPPSCVWQYREDVYFDMPEANFASELEFHYGTGSTSPTEAMAEATGALLDMESLDVLETLKEESISEERKRSLLETYIQVRRITRGFVSPVPPRTLSDGRVDAIANNSGSVIISRFDFSVFRPLLKELPEEFSLYAEGAAFYHLGDFKRAATLWQALLDLPPEQRHYRSVWAAYMLGKATLHLDTASAIPYFNLAQALNAEGFSDRALLGTDSLGWQAQAEALMGEYRASILHYMEQFRRVPWADRRPIPSSLDFVCGKMLREGPPPEAVVRDPLCREVITLWVLSRRAKPEHAKLWSDALVSMPPEGPVAQAGRLAQLYYEAGQMELAARWVPLASPNDAIARWVHSKLLFREGKLAEAEVVLTDLVTAARRKELSLAHSDGWRDTSWWQQNTPGLPENNLGVVRLNLDDYAGALDAFLAAGSVWDSTYIADQIMTADELEAYLRNHPGGFPVFPEDSSFWQDMSTSELLRYVLARKLARTGNFSKARPYYPEFLPQSRDSGAAIPLREILDHYCDSLRAGHDEKRSKRERAEALFDAGMISKKWGMELLGMEHAPDWRLVNGSYDLTDTTRMGMGTATAMEAKRIGSNAPVPNQRFHYRALGPKLLQEAATLLPDQDERTAQVLWYGGQWPYPYVDSDKFYKALVRRCRKLPIGKLADDTRWFPPRPDSWGELEFDGTLPPPPTPK